MTLTDLIITNAVLGAVVLYALVRFLMHGIHADRRLNVSRTADVTRLPAQNSSRIAA